MARDALAFIDALELTRIDLLGFSIGGMIAQELTLLCPQLVRRLVLAGTGPQSGQLMHGWVSDVAALANVAKNHPEDLLALFFEITPTSQQKGREFLQRCGARQDDRDVPRLQVRFPPEIATHNPDQVFYFDALGLQRRLDYIAEVNGSTLVGHCTSRYKTFGGLLVATRRRVFRRNPDNTVDLNLLSITLDIHDVELVRSGDGQAPP